MVHADDEIRSRWSNRLVRFERGVRSDMRRLWTEEGAFGSVCQRFFPSLARRNELVATTVTDKSDSSTSGADASASSASSSAWALSGGLPYNRRMNLIPKRNLQWALYHCLVNVQRGTIVALRCVPAFVVAQSRSRGPVVGIPAGLVLGSAAAFHYVALMCVASPLLHISGGFFNIYDGLVNCYKGNRFFNSEQGWYDPAAASDWRRNMSSLQASIQNRIAEATAEHSAQAREADSMITRVTGKGVRATVSALYDAAKGKIMGARKTPEDDAQGKGPRGQGEAGSSHGAEPLDPYSTLQVAPTASPKVIKESYNRLAKVLHPDVNRSDPLAAEKFQQLTSAYKILNDPESRKAYDMGGMEGRQLASMGGVAGAGFLKGSPATIIQQLFGGVPFQELFVGPLYRSTFHMQSQNGCAVNLQDLEILQAYRIKLIAAVLVEIVDAFALDNVGAMALTAYASAQAAAESRQSLENVSTADTDHADRRGAQPSSRTSPMPTVQVASKTVGGASTTTSAASATMAAVKGNTSMTFSHVLRDDVVQKFRISVQDHPDFSSRCQALAQYLSKCSYGRELLHEIGISYLVNAKRFSQDFPPSVWYRRPWEDYQAKLLINVKATGGILRTRHTLRHSRAKDLEATAMSLLDMEWENALTDVHIVSRFAAMAVMNDTCLSSVVRQRLGWNELGAETVSGPSASPDTPNGTGKGLHQRPLTSTEAAGKRLAGGSRRTTIAMSSTMSPGGASSGSNLERWCESVRRRQLDVHARELASPVPSAVLKAAPSPLARQSAKRPSVVSSLAGQTGPPVGKLLAEVPQSERERIVQAVTEEVRQRRIKALGYLGHTFATYGKAWEPKPGREALIEARTHTTSSFNNALPPPF